MHLLTTGFVTPWMRLACLGALLAVPAAMGMYEHHGAVRGHDWLQEQKDNLSVSDPGNFCSAVFGDSKRNFACLSAVLREVERDPQIAFAIHTGDLVGDGRRETSRETWTSD